jgi:crotonobetainyl-CoA:carnitine CoA-transferase CaiB-like acyl-CoA transferase
VVNHVFPAWDFISGQMIAVGMLAAERHRRLTGEGQLVRLALKDVALAMLGNFGMIAEVMVNDADRPRQGNYLYGAFGRDFETLDGKRLDGRRPDRHAVAVSHQGHGSAAKRSAALGCPAWPRLGRRR